MVRLAAVRNARLAVVLGPFLGSVWFGCSGTSVEKTSDPGAAGTAGVNESGSGGVGKSGAGTGGATGGTSSSDGGSVGTATGGASNAGMGTDGTGTEGAGTDGMGMGGTASGEAGNGGADDSASAGAAGEPPNGGDVKATLDALCSAPDGTEVTFVDEEDATAQLTGKWVLCSGPGLEFASEQPNQAGIELTADKGWYILDLTSEGLTRATGFFASGAYRFQPPQDLDYGPSPSALLFMGADYSFNTVRMLDSPRKMRFEFTALSGQPSIYALVAP